MPQAAYRPCRPGCPHLVRAGEPCPDHPAHTSDQPWVRQSSHADKRVRGRKWVAIRLQVISEEPRCAICQQWGHDNDEVDHADGNVANNDRANLRRVHKACHKPLTHAQSMRGRG